LAVGQIFGIFSRISTEILNLAVTFKFGINLA